MPWRTPHHRTRLARSPTPRTARAGQRKLSETEPDLFAPGATTWHNFDELDVPTEPASYDALRTIRTVCPDFDFHEIHTHQVDDGTSIAQYVLAGTPPNGSPVRVHGVLIAHSANGQITRLQEYFDPAQLAPMFKLLKSAR